MPGVDAYGPDRDARSYSGSLPVVAHPPCRSWSAFTRHQAKPEPGESELGIWCCDTLKRVGGILEQPAHSRLFRAGGLPEPGEQRDGQLFSLEVWQAWWGYPVKKNTWLCFAGIDWQAIELPFVLHNPGFDRKAFAWMSKKQRSRTTLEFATWLVELAAGAKV